jgi:hypothetical protein
MSADLGSGKYWHCVGGILAYVLTAVSAIAGYIQNIVSSEMAFLNVAGWLQFCMLLEPVRQHQPHFVFVIPKTMR